MMSEKVDHAAFAGKPSLDSNLAQGDPSATILSRDTWKVYHETSSQEDQKAFSGWQSDMDSLLIFATLFSTVLTTFVVFTIPDLQEDENVKVLRQILQTLQNNGTAIATSGDTFHPSTSDVRVNVLWFSSLILSISTSFMAILAKQWIYNLSVDTSPLPVTGGRQRQYRRNGVIAWKLHSIITSLPVLLHISVLLFFAGLLEYLWTINRLVAAVTTAFVSVTVLVYCTTSVLSMIYPSCPYKTSLTSLIFSGIDSLLESVFRMIMALGLSINHTSAVIAERFLCSGRAAKFTEAHTLTHSQMAKMVQNLNTNDSVTSAWRSIAPQCLDPKKREDASIQEEKSRLDAEALAWMVERSSKMEDVSPLAKELCHFKELLGQKMLFLESDAVMMLVRHLHAVCAVSDEGAQDVREEVYETLDALLQLTTETRDVDSSMTPFLGRGYPYFHVFLDIGSFAGGISTSSVIRADPCAPDLFHNDLCFVAATLRLSVAVSYEEDWKQFNVSHAIDDFYSRVSANSCAELKNSSERSLRTVLDTVIFIGLHATNFDLSSLTSSDLVHKSLELLSTISINVSPLSYTLRRQICWAIWALAYGLDSNHTLLSVAFKYCACVVPRLTGSGDWAEHFAAVLQVTGDRVVLEATMTVMEGLLYSRESRVTKETTYTIDNEKEDCERLCDAFAAVFPTFLTNYVASLLEGTTKKTAKKNKHEDEKEHAIVNMTFYESTPDYIKRLIKISGYLAFYHREKQSPEDAILIRDSLELLNFLFAHRHTPPFCDHPHIDRWLWNTLCGITSLQFHDEALLKGICPSIEEFASENTAVQSIATSFIFILHACQYDKSAPLTPMSESVATMLRVLQKALKKSHDDTQDTIELRDALLKHEVVAVLNTLDKGQYGVAVSEVLNAMS